MTILALLIQATLLQPAAPVPSTHAEDPLTEASCALMLSAGDADAEIVEVAGLSALSPPPHQPSLHVELEPGLSLDAVICWRSRAEIGPNDDWVASTGVPLYIKEDGDRADSPVLVLERTEVGYRVQVIAGPELSPEQAERTVSLIDTFNLRVNPAD